ncbi:Immunoglobulin (CD79A) binding protein 1, partial [Saguinus oedipus]
IWSWLSKPGNYDGDWYEQHRKYGALPDQGEIKATAEELRKAAQQQEDQEEKEEEDDEQTLYRAR